MKSRWNLIFFVVLLAFIFYTVRHAAGARTIPYSQFVALVDGGYVLSGAFEKDTFSGKTTPSAPSLPSANFTVNLPPSNSPAYGVTVEKLLTQGIQFEFRRPWIENRLGTLLMTVLFPLAFVAFIWMFFMKQARRTGQIVR